MREFDGAGAMVTGAGDGIGRALARRLSERGASVAVVDIEGAAALRTADEIRAAGGHATAHRCDVSDRVAVRDLVQEVQEAHGTVRILCNNAGVSHFAPVAYMNDGDWDWVLAVNLQATIVGIAAFLPGMLACGRDAHILNTASTAGLAAPLGQGLAAYAVSKSGVVALSEVLDDELRDTRVRVSLLCPGATRTTIYASERRRPADFGAPSRTSPPRTPADGAMTAERVADIALRGMEDDQLYIPCDPATRSRVDARFAAIAAGYDWLERACR